MTPQRYRPPYRFGLGGVAIGNEFEFATDEQAEATLAAAWDAGVRYFDVSPWYGLGLAERRFGRFLARKPRHEFVLSSKVGKLLRAGRDNQAARYFPFTPSPNTPHFDYTADGILRSVEDSLQRLGLDRLDIVFVHDLSPDNAYLPEDWDTLWPVAERGAFPALTRLRDEGVIDGWGMGVNCPQPILRCLECADSDVHLLASQYSLIDHANAVEQVFPKAREKGVSFVVGSALNAGFLGGEPRYNYGEDNTVIPADKREKRDALRSLAGRHGVDLVAAALQFSLAPDVASALIVGTAKPFHILADHAALRATIPALPTTRPCVPRSPPNSGRTCGRRASSTPTPPYRTDRDRHRVLRLPCTRLACPCRRTGRQGGTSMRRWTRLPFGLVALWGLTVASPASAACKVAKIAELPVTLIGQRAMVPAKFGDRDTRFIVDSGAFYSTLSRASAAEFGLSTESAPAWFRLQGINGDTAVSIAVAKNFSLADIPIPRVNFLVGGSDTGTAGLLGQNILGLGDVEYDLPHGAVRLMRVEGCGDRALAYWTQGKPFSVIPLERGKPGPWKPHTIGTVLVNGIRMRAIFDSGAQGTIMTLAAAKRAGITPTSPGVVPVGSGSGIGSRQVATWLAPFDRIDLGGEIVPHPKFRIADIGIDGDLLIGFDFFLTHRMFVSNANGLLYMTYEGGSLFGLTPKAARTAAGEKLDLTDKAADPTDAEGFSRRGAVFMSHHKYAEGLADFDKAVAMAPNEGRYVFLRAQGRMANRQLSLAAADLDRAAVLMPADPDVRLMRARLRLASRDAAGAAEDVGIADRGLPPGSDRRLGLAGLYDSLDQPERAIANYDAWLKLHGEDADRATAYNGRCWARALLNRELDRALSDCKTALRLRPGDAAYLDSRALVQLRLGKLDAALADYDAALKSNPRNAWSLYARAIAEKRAGKTEAAAIDQKAALAIDPGVADRAVRYGLER